MKTKLKSFKIKNVFLKKNFKLKKKIQRKFQKSFFSKFRKNPNLYQKYKENTLKI